MPNSNENIIRNFIHRAPHQMSFPPDPTKLNEEAADEKEPKQFTATVRKGDKNRDQVHAQEAEMTEADRDLNYGKNYRRGVLKPIPDPNNPGKFIEPGGSYNALIWKPIYLKDDNGQIIGRKLIRRGRSEKKPSAPPVSPGETWDEDVEKPFNKKKPTPEKPGKGFHGAGYGGGSSASGGFNPATRPGALHGAAQAVDSTVGPSGAGGLNPATLVGGADALSELGSMLGDDPGMEGLSTSDLMAEAGDDGGLQSVDPLPPRKSPPSSNPVGMEGNENPEAQQAVLDAMQAAQNVAEGGEPLQSPLDMTDESQFHEEYGDTSLHHVAQDGYEKYKGSGADLGKWMSPEKYQQRMAENRIRTEKNRAKRKAYADQERYYKKHLRPGEFAFQTWGMPGSAASQFGQALAQQYGAMMQAPGQAQLARDKMASDERIAGIQAGDADEKRNTNMLAMYQMLATQAAALPVGHPSRKAIEAQMAAISAQIMGGGSSGGGVPNWLTPALPGRGGQGGGSQGGDGTLDISNYDYWPEDHMNNAWLEAGGDVRPALDDISEELDGTEMGDSGFLGDDAFDDMVDWMWDLGVLINEGTVTQENLPLVMHHLKSKMSPTVWNYLTTEQFGKPLDPEHGEWVGGYDTEEINPAHIEFMKAIMSGKLPTSQQIQAIQKEGWFWS